MTVSVIIPAYNPGEDLSIAVDSALNQTLADLEVIIVDDGSTDGTSDLVGAIKDPRVRYVYQENEGQSAAINRGASLATGEFIKLLDADDWLNSRHLESQLDSLRDHPNCISSCAWGYFTDDFSTPAIREECTNKNYSSPLEWIIDSLTRDQGMMGGWKWLIPKHVWNRSGGFARQLTLNNDFHFSIQLLLSCDGVRFANEAVYSYRKTMGGTLSGSQGRKAMESAYMTTALGARLLLEREDSTRTRKICADRFQRWLYQFYPSFPDLVDRTEHKISELGGSDLSIDGGRILKLLLPIIGWKGVRQLQHCAYRSGWQYVLNHKTRKRIQKLS